MNEEWKNEELILSEKYFVKSTLSLVTSLDVVKRCFHEISVNFHSVEIMEIHCHLSLTKNS